MPVTDYIYRLKAMPGDTTPHDELGVSADLGTGTTTSLVDRGAGDMAWRFSAGRTSITIPNIPINVGAIGEGCTMAFTVKVVNSGTTAYRAILGIGPDALPEAYASASTAPGLFFSRHGASTVRAVAVGATYTNNLTTGTTEYSYVVRFSTNETGNYEVVRMWQTTPGRVGDDPNISSSLIIVSSSNTGTWDTLSICCDTGVIIELKDLAIWDRELTYAESAAIADNLRGQLDAAADTEAPVFTGTIAESGITTSQFTHDWSGCVRTDNVGITGYQTSSDNVNWTDRGNVTSYTYTGLAPNTAYLRYVRAHDGASPRNYSASLNRTTTTAQVVSDTAVPVMTGVLTESNVTADGFSMTCPVATDDVAVAGYEYSIDNGVNWGDLGPERTVVLSSLASSTSYTVLMRAYDTAAKRSTPALSKTVVTLDSSSAQFVSPILTDNFNVPRADLGGWTVFIHNVTTGALLATKTDLTTDAFGVLIFNEPLAQLNTDYRLVFRTATGAEGMKIVKAI